MDDIILVLIIGNKFVFVYFGYRRGFLYCGIFYFFVMDFSVGLNRKWVSILSFYRSEEGLERGRILIS